MKKCVLWLVVILMLLNTGCVEKKVKNIQVDSEAINYVTYNLGRLPENLLLLDSDKIRERDLLIPLFEGLVKEDEFGNVVPGLAESWIIGTDDITYDFKIRENAKWSDGTDITAEDFVKFFVDILNPKVKNIYSSELYYIFGTSEYRNDKKTSSGIAIRAVDRKNLQIRLNAPSNCFLYILSQPIYNLRKIDDKLQSWQLDYKDIVYSGPFVLDNISPEGKLTLTKNENYYEKEEIKSQQLFITSIENSESALAKFQNSSINLFINPPAAESKDMIINGDAQSVSVKSGVSLNFNLKKSGNISDANFRKAIGLIIDRTEIANSYMNNLVRTASAYVPGDWDTAKSNGFKESKLFKDIADYASGKMLIEQGQYDLKQKLKLIYSFSYENKRMFEGIAKDIKDALGVGIECVGLNEYEYSEALKNGDYHLAAVEFNSSYSDPMALLENWLSNSRGNLYGYKNINFDTLLLQAKYEKDRKKRDELLKSAEELLSSDIPSIPLYFDNVLLCSKKYVKGAFVTEEGNLNLCRAYIER